MKRQKEKKSSRASMSQADLTRLIGTLKDGDGLSRDKAQEALIAAHDPSVVEGVAPLLKASDTGTRMMALEILKATGNDNIEAIISLLDDENEDVRVYACEIITCLKHVDTVPYLIKKTVEDNDNVRNSACMALGGFDDERAVDALLNALKDDDWVTFTAIFSLGQIGSKKAIPSLLDVFRTGGEEISLAACETLMDFRDPGVLDEVIETLKGWDQKKREVYMKVMLERGEEDIFLKMKEKIGDELFGHLLNCVNYENKRTLPIMRLLAYFRTPAACEAILETASHLDPEAEEYCDVLECLADLKDVWVGEVGRYMTKGDQYTFPIVKACVMGGAKIGEDVLLAAYLSAPVETRREIIENMGRIHEGAGFEIISKAIHDPDGHVQGSAVAQAGNMGFTQLAEEIGELSKTSYTDVRSKALKALIRLDTAKASDLIEDFVNNGSVDDKKVFLSAANVLDSDRNFPYLSKLLQDTDEGIRKATIAVFGNFLEDERYMSILTSLLKDEDIPHEALKIVKDKKLIAFRDRLIDVFLDKSKGMWTRYYALSALDGFRDGSLFDLFLEGLEDENSLIKIGSVNALSSLNDPKALLYIEPFTRSEDEDIRSTAEAALSRLENL